MRTKKLIAMVFQKSFIYYLGVWLNGWAMNYVECIFFAEYGDAATCLQGLVKLKKHWKYKFIFV